MTFNPNASSDSGAPDTVSVPHHEAGGGLGRSLPPGTMLDQYQIQRVLSASGFSVVYLAKDLSADIFVVIKEYLPTNLVDHVDSAQSALRGVALATAYKRGKFAFLSESRTLAGCDHHSLVRVNRILELHDTLYRVMPCYYGKTLQASRQLSTLGLDETSIYSLLDGLLGALSTLHAHDCVHGAVSPAKVLWLADNRPLLMDFSAVRRGVVSLETQRRMAMREPSYLPLEQMEPFQLGLVPGPWSDVYSAAAVAYFCIAGELPARNNREPIIDVARRLQKQRRAPAYSEALLKSIDGALAERLQDRPQTAAEFREMLLMPPATPVSAAQSRQEAGERGSVEPPAQQQSAVLVDGAPEPQVPVCDDPVVRPSPAANDEASRPLRNFRALTWVGVSCAMIVLALVAWKFDQQREDQEVLASLGAVTVPTDSHQSRPAQVEQVVESTSPAVSPDMAGETVADPMEDAVLPTSEIVLSPAAGKPVEPVKRPPLRESSSPVAACGPRTEFSLYKCVKTQCAQAQWSAHAQCRRLRETDEVVP